MSAMRKHNVTTFPRPPIVERTNRHIQIKWHGQLVADCPPGEAYWVLEAHHAPSAYPFFSFSISFSITVSIISISIPVLVSQYPFLPFSPSPYPSVRPVSARPISGG